MSFVTDLSFFLGDIWVDPAWLYAIVQIGVLVVFIGAAYRAARQSKSRFMELMSAVVFGLLLEEGDIIIFQTYRYDPHWFALDLVPPAIALCWALIIASAMNITDALGVAERVAPFADAVWAILLDLAFDAIAIRLGLWRWTIPKNADWFGVPYGNFYAWLWVATSFSFFTRWVRRRTTRYGARQVAWQIGVPFVAYIGLLAGVSPYAFLQSVYFRTVGSDWILISLAFATYGFITARAMMSRHRISREAADPYLMAIRYMMHLYFLWALISTGMFLQIPLLFLVSLAMLTVETVLVFVIARHEQAPAQGLLAWADLILERWGRD